MANADALDKTQVNVLSRAIFHSVAQCPAGRNADLVARVVSAFPAITVVIAVITAAARTAERGCHLQYGWGHSLAVVEDGNIGLIVALLSGLPEVDADLRGAMLDCVVDVLTQRRCRVVGS